MARKADPNELIRCEECGEEYSPTYRRCPFCGEKSKNRSAPQKSAEDDGYVFEGGDLFDDIPSYGDEEAEDSTPKKGGGKRLASGKAARSSGKRSSSAGGARIVTFILSLIIIVAALVIVFTVIYPKLHTKRPSNPGPNPSPSVSQPAQSETPAPAPDTKDENPLNSLSLGSRNDQDFTLMVGQSNTPTVITDPLDWDGTLVWTSSNEECATVDENGTITNVNQTASLRRVTITVTGGGQTLEINVYCRGTDAPDDAPPVQVPTTDEPATEQPGTPSTSSGSKAKVVNAEDGLNVRKGPGTKYEVQDSLKNGDEVKILEKAEDGWYKISYHGIGVMKTGYVKGTYLQITNN